MVTKQYSRNFFLGVLFMAKSLPPSFFLMGLPIILRLEGYSLSAIGMFQMASLPYLFKFLWAPVLDINSHRKNHYKSWILVTGLGVGIWVTLLGWAAPKNQIEILFAMIMGISFLTATMDIAISSLYIKLFSYEERGLGATGKILAVNLATIFSSGILIMVYNHAGWVWVTNITGSMILAFLVALMFLEEPCQQSVTKGGSAILWSGILTFFTRPGMLKWMALLILKSTSITAVFFMMKPFLVDQGYDPDSIAFLTGMFAVMAGALATMATGLGSVQKFILNRRRALVFCVGLNAVAVALFVPVFLGGSPVWLVYPAVALMNAALSFVSVVSGTLIMDFAQKGSEGIDYSLQITAIHAGGLGMAAISGIMAEWMGYGCFFVFHAFLGIALILLTASLFKGHWIPGNGETAAPFFQ